MIPTNLNAKDLFAQLINYVDPAQFKKPGAFRQLSDEELFNLGAVTLPRAPIRHIARKVAQGFPRYYATTGFGEGGIKGGHINLEVAKDFVKAMHRLNPDSPTVRQTVSHEFGHIRALKDVPTLLRAYGQAMGRKASAKMPDRLPRVLINEVLAGMYENVKGKNPQAVAQSIYGYLTQGSRNLRAYGTELAQSTTGSGDVKLLAEYAGRNPVGLLRKLMDQTVMPTKIKQAVLNLPWVKNWPKLNIMEAKYRP